MPKFTFADQLPRRISKGRCKALDETGNQCRRQASAQVFYFGSEELHRKIPWVVVELCPPCYRAFEDISDFFGL